MKDTVRRAVATQAALTAAILRELMARRGSAASRRAGAATPLHRGVMAATVDRAEATVAAITEALAVVADSTVEAVGAATVVVADAANSVI